MIDYKGMQMEREHQTAQHLQIRVMKHLWQLQRALPPVEKTILIYDVCTPSSPSLNLHTFAQILIHPHREVTVAKQILKKTIHYTYSISEREDSTIDKIQFQFCQDKSTKDSSIEQVVIYQSKSSSLRVIALPFQKDVVDMEKVSHFYKGLELRVVEESERVKKEGLRHDAKKEALDSIRQEKEERLSQFKESETQRHLQMFQIEGLLATCFQATQKVSICCLAEHGTGHHKDYRQYLAEFKDIFEVPKEFTPQVILHSFSEEEDDESEMGEEVSTIFSLSSDDKMGLKRDNHMDEGHFWSVGTTDREGEGRASRLRTRLLSQANNEVLVQINNNFVQSWKQITMSTCGCFAKTMQEVQKLSKEPAADCSFAIGEIYEAYQFRSLQLPGLPELHPSTSSTKNSSQGRRFSSIPAQIKELVLTYRFSKIGRQFLEGYLEKERSLKRDQTALLWEWQAFLQEVYQLLFSMGEEESSSQLQQFLSCVSFVLGATKIVKQATSIETAVSNSLKLVLENVLPRKDMLIRHVIESEKDILKEQPVEYYDLLLEIVRCPVPPELQSETKYIQCCLLQLKAFCIATRNIHDETKIVEAIRSYAYICLEHPSLTPERSNKISLLDIEKRMARLLIIVAKEELAAQIYFKLRMIGKAHQTCEFAQKHLTGDGKARKLIEWGGKFEREIEYDLAMGYYRSAYECADSIELLKESVQCKLDCNENRKNGPPEEVSREFQQFLRPETTTLTDFTSATDLSELYLKLKTELEWDEDLETASFKA